MWTKEASAIITQTMNFVKGKLTAVDGGHDWNHIQRVYRWAVEIGREEGADLMVVSLGALLHDVVDEKFQDTKMGQERKTLSVFLQSLPLSEEVIQAVEYIIDHVSYRSGLNQTIDSTIELQVVQDADRLDALGAIGVARAFNYGGFRNRPLFDPSIPLIHHNNPEDYGQAVEPTIHHFYDKLLRLKDLMHTTTGRKIAEERHQFLLSFLRQFYAEWFLSESEIPEEFSLKPYA